MTSQQDDEQWLHKGWQWLEGHADHDPLPEQYVWLEEEWLRRLRWYEEAYRLVNEPIRKQSAVDAKPNPRLPQKHDLGRGRTTGADDRSRQNRQSHRQSSF